jgi:hypothetical protein
VIKLLTFPQFVAADPELTPYARDTFLRIDAEAERVGTRIIANTTSDELRARGGSPWLLGINATLAAALERDPSGRLAAVPALRVWAYMADIPQMWITWYAVLLEKHIDHLKQPIAEAAE